MKQIIIYIITILLFILLGLMAFQSDFAKIKKKPSGNQMAENIKKKAKLSDKRRFSTKVKINNDSNFGNLGDFIINTDKNKKLRINIAFEYEDISGSLFGADKLTLSKNSVILRDRVISSIRRSRSYKIEDLSLIIREDLNLLLSNFRIKEIYFNNFIEQ